MAGRQHRRLRCEVLESRLLLAGDVSVQLSPVNDMIIVGDARANDIQVVSHEVGGVVVPGAFEVRSGPRATTFNGGQAGPVVIQGVTGNIRANLRAGSDRLVVSDDGRGTLGIPTDLVVIGGRGNDVLQVEGAAVAGKLNIKAGAGNDRVSIHNSTIGGEVTVDTSNGNDKVAIVKSQINGVATLQTSAGNDAVGINGLTTSGDLVINTGAGRDVIGGGVDPSPLGVTWAQLGVPAVVTPDATFGVKVGGTVRVNSGSGADKVGFELSSVAVDAIFTTAGGADVLLFQNNTVDGRVSLKTGAGNDRVEAASNTIGGGLTINLGRGNDRLRAVSNNVAGLGRLLGGTGFDILSDGGGNVFGNPGGLPIVRGFERLIV